jgi:hypothetical protein
VSKIIKMHPQGDWLIRAGRMELGDSLSVYPRGDLDWPTARAALDAQYGKGEFTAWTHGNALHVKRLQAPAAISTNQAVEAMSARKMLGVPLAPAAAPVSPKPGPGYGWTLSDEAARTIAEIERRVIRAFPPWRRP